MNFASSKIDNIIFKKEILEDADFLEVKMKNVYFKKINLYHSDFISTCSKGIYFSDCNISGTKFDYCSIKEIITNEFEYQSIVGMLGV